MSVAVIIPVLDDAAALRRCLGALAQSTSAPAEIIVADGGASEDCRLAAVKAGALYLTSARGRARQMNAGAAGAKAEWFWFLHADCTPSPDSIAQIEQLKGCPWGSFRHRIGAPGISFRLIERMDNLRARFLAMPFGDQGIFVRRDIFREIGGFEEVPLLEDVKLSEVLRKRRHGHRMLRPWLTSDARRWNRYGVFKVTFTNWRILWLYYWKRKSAGELVKLYELQTNSSPNIRTNTDSNII